MSKGVGEEIWPRWPEILKSIVWNGSNMRERGKEESVLEIQEFFRLELSMKVEGIGKESQV